MVWVVENYAASNWTEYETTWLYTETGYWVGGYCENEWAASSDPASDWMPA